MLAIDPGVRTGAALVEVTEDSAPVLLGYWEIPGGLEGFQEWWALRPEYDTLVAEDFDHREGVRGVDHTPERILGWLSTWTPILQKPAGRKRAVPDDALKRLGLYLPGERQRNAREAVRHAIVYLKNSGHRPTIRKGFVSIDW